MSDDEILESYKQLYRIENCFRITKTDLSTRPIYVRTPLHVEAHFLTCFISLVMLRILAHQTGHSMSCRRMIKALSAKALPLGNGYWWVEGDKDLIALLEIFGISWQKRYVKHEDLNRFALAWCTTR